MVMSMCLLAGMAMGFSPVTDTPWAEAYFNYTSIDPQLGFDTPQKSLGKPVGGSLQSPNLSSLVTLGTQGGTITLKFHSPVVDDPANPKGLDCIVYSNAFWVGGNPQLKWQEPALIEISQDVNGNGLPDDPWYLIPGSNDYRYSPYPWKTEPVGISNASDPYHIMSGNVRNPNLADTDTSNDTQEYYWGYAKLNPTAQEYLDNYVRPDDPKTVGITGRSGGGDAFDIAWAVDQNGQPANLHQFDFIRFTSFISRDMEALGTASPEIDAVADVAANVDTDGDGILDDYETRVAGTDPLRAESTVLPLEIPSYEGGSPVNTVLGMAQDTTGTKLRLYADQQRTNSARRFNVLVDILPVTPPAATLSDASFHLAGIARSIVTSESDFVSAEIQPAEITLHYTATDISGLDEESLQPYRYDSSATRYTQDGITDVQRNASANLVVFRTRYPGTFALVAPTGTGDATTEGPQGTIVLHATPEGTLLADPATSVTFTSDLIHTQDNAIVPDGTLITVHASAGTILAEDHSTAIGGIQVETVSGRITFGVQAPKKAGGALITATSVSGAAYGEYALQFVPGQPASPVSLRMEKPSGDGPVTVTISPLFSVVEDRFGNTVADGSLLTIDVTGGTLLTPDASDALPGSQVPVEKGLFQYEVQVSDPGSSFTCKVYGNADKTTLLAEETFIPEEYQPMPLKNGVLLIVIGAVLIFIFRRVYAQGMQR